MRQAIVPARFFRTPCFACGATIRFPLCEADSNNFATYRGRRSGDYYRFEIGYETEVRLVALAKDREGDGGLERLPDELSCPTCGAFAGVPRSNLYGLSGDFAPVEGTVEIVIVE
jgi:hypothetical protein